MSPDARSRAHARYASRYARQGDLPKAVSHFGRALRYQKSTASRFGMNGPDVSAVSSGLAEMRVGAKSERRWLLDYSEYRVLITIHAPTKPFPGLERSALNKLKETLYSKLEESLGIEEVYVPRVLLSLERGERPRVSVLVYTMDESVIEPGDKTALSDAGIGSGILQEIKRIAPQFVTSEIEVKYPEVRIYALYIQLYADSKRHPTLELGAPRPVSDALAGPIEIDSKSGLRVLCKNAVVSFVESAGPPHVRVAVLRGDGRVLGEPERVVFDESNTSTFFVERIRSAIRGLGSTLAEVPIEIAYERAPAAQYEVKVYIRVDEDKHPAFRGEVDTGLKRALEAHLKERGISAKVTFDKLVRKKGPVDDPSIGLVVFSTAATAPGLTPSDVQTFEASGIGELIRKHIADFDPGFPVPDHIGISKRPFEFLASDRGF
jgi:hypothetical protein